MGNESSTSAAPKWTRDGHMAGVYLDCDALVIRLECPNNGDYTGADWDHLPMCRRNWTEGGQPDPENSPLTFCNFAEWAENVGVIDCVDTEITGGHDYLVVGPIPIGWRWDSGDELYLWAPSVLIDQEAEK